MRLEQALVLGCALWAAASRAEEPADGPQLDLSELLDLKVSAASLKTEAVESAPAVATIFQASDFERYQLRSVADALALTPGLDMLYDQTFYNLGVRGINAGWNAQSRVIKAVIDGQDASFRPTRGNLLGPEFFPLLAIDRVEVIRGPLSALYGADAFLGVVNVVPATAEQLTRRYDGNFLVRGTYVNRWGNHAGNVDGLAWLDTRYVSLIAGASWHGGRRDGLTLPASGTNQYQRLSNIRPSLTSSEDSEYLASIWARLTVKDFGIGTFKLETILQHADRSANFNPNSEPLLHAVEGLSNGIFRLSHHVDFTSWFELNSSVSVTLGLPTGSQRYYDDFRPSFVAGRDYLRRNYGSTAIDARTAASATLGPVLLTVGADLSYDIEKLPALFTSFNGVESEVPNPDGVSKSFWNGGAFAQAIWTPLKPLKFIAGGRIDQHSLYGFQPSWRVGAVWTATSSTWLKLLVASSFQAPSTNLLYTGADARLLGPISNPFGLKPQYATSIELSATQKLLGNRLVAQLTLFGMRVADFAQFNTQGGNPTPENAGTILSAGGELSITYNPIKTAQVFGSLSISRASFTETSTGVTQETRLYPWISGRLGGSVEVWPRHVRAFSTMQFIGPRRPDSSNLREASGDYVLAPYALIDLGLSSVGIRLWGDRETLITLTCRNLLNTASVEPGFAGIDVPGALRAFSLSLKQEL